MAAEAVEAVEVVEAAEAVEVEEAAEVVVEAAVDGGPILPVHLKVEAPERASEVNSTLL